MAIENAKLLNVRIKNKYDSYENWASSGLVLEAGEIAIAYTTVDVAVNNGTAKHPALLMKVGDGEKTFANLPWLSAKAADVLSVCKNEDDLKGFVNGVIANAGIATDAAMKELSGKVTTAEGAIDALEALVGTDKVADQIQNAIAALNLDTTYEKVNVAKGLVDALAGGAVKDNADAIAEINNEETGVLAQAKAHANGLDSAMDARVDIVEAKLSDIDEKYTVGQVIDFEIKNVEAEIGQLGRTLGQDIVKINSKLKGFADSDYAVYNAIAAAKEAGENAQADVDALELVVAKQADVDAALALKADQTALNAVSDVANAAVKQADYDVKVAALEAEDARIVGLVEAEATKAREEEGKLDARLVEVETFFKTAEGETLDTALDTLVEIQTYVDTHGEVADQMVKDIAANKKAIEDMDKAYKEADESLQGEIDALEGRIDDAEAALETVDTRIANAITEADLGQYVTGTDFYELAKKVANLETADGEQDTLLAGLRTDVDAKATQADLEAEAAIARAAEKANLDAINAIKDGEVIDSFKDVENILTQLEGDVETGINEALADAKTYADGKDTVMNARVEALEAKDVVLYSDTIVFDCGTSAI